MLGCTEEKASKKISEPDIDIFGESKTRISRN